MLLQVWIDLAVPRGLTSRRCPMRDRAMMQRSLAGVLLVFVAGATHAVAADPLQEVARRINAKQQQHKLSKLKYNDKLAKAAESQADWMASVGKMEHLRGQVATSFEKWKQQSPSRESDHPRWLLGLAGTLSLEVKDGQQVLVAKPGANDHVGEICSRRSPVRSGGFNRP